MNIDNVSDLVSDWTDSMQLLAEVVFLSKDDLSEKMLKASKSCIVDTPKLLLSQNGYGNRQSFGGLPAEVTYYPSGNLKSMVWANASGNAHSYETREGYAHPAVVIFEDDSDRTVKIMEWCDNGTRHRFECPARYHFINYGPNTGSVTATFFWKGEISRPLHLGPARYIIRDSAIEDASWCYEGEEYFSSTRKILEKTRISLALDHRVIYYSFATHS